jgi:hypothetical protein
MSTNVPPVQFGPNGFEMPSEADILAGRQEDINAAFGGNLNFTTSTGGATNPTPQGQIASSEAAIIGAADSTFLFFTNQVDPAYAQGRMQDAIARIYFIERKPAEPTVIQVACLGAVGTSIPAFSSLVADAAGNIYACSTGGTIPSGGSITLPFAAQIPGPIAVPESVSIYQAIPGWDSTSVSSGAIGSNVESRAQFEERRAASVAGNSFGAIASILGAVSSVPGVLDYYGYDNGTNAPATVLGVTIPANSIFIAVVGGDQNTVAQAIWSKKAPGCSYFGNTSVVVTDPNPLYSTPPSYTVEYETPAGLQFYFAVNIVAGPNVPSNAATLIQNAIIAAFAGSDLVPRPRIASLVLSTSFIAQILMLGTWAQVRSIQIGSINTPTATFTGAISGTTLTTSGATGTIAIGQYLDDGVAGIIPGTMITAGSGTSWTVNNSQTVSSETMYGLTANQNSVQVQANQEPEIQAVNIVVTVS